jgi:hypothetical protein
MTEKFIVYRASGPKSNSVYYGYASDTRDARKTFLSGAARSEDTRADVRLLALNGDDPDSIKIEALDEADSEYEAWVFRNDARASDPDSITGPSHFPGQFWKRAGKENPEKIAKWTETQTRQKVLQTAKTGRDLLVGNIWSNAEVATAAANAPGGKAAFVKDLDNWKLSAPDFATKYNLPFA